MLKRSRGSMTIVMISYDKEQSHHLSLLDSVLSIEREKVAISMLLLDEEMLL